MRILLIAALLSSALFESHQLAGQTSAVTAVSTDTQTKDGSTSAIKNPVTDEKKKVSRFNIPTKTAGGTQVWTDHSYRDGYRIQEHSLTGHFRLLDSGNIRRAWGTYDQCEATLDTIIPAKSITENPKHVAVLLHGLMRTSHSMKTLELALLNEKLDDVIRFQYASTRRSIDDHAAALRKVLENQPSNTEFSFAGHSMGNIVVRRLVGELQADGDPTNILPRCRSMVMLGPPNQGASISRRLAPTGLYGIVTGKGGMQLGPQWNEFVKKLATPPFPFAIVAGDVSANIISNPLVDGDGDFVVSLDEAKLQGCAEFHTLPVLHSFLMNDPRAVDFAVKFITVH